MRNSKDRRDPRAAARFPLEDNERERVLAERRKTKERRIENLDAEERQLLLSELPWPSLSKRP
jgi:hypothetical protein